jgi:hypothetical protein
MGGTSFSRDDYDARDAYRSATSTPVFAYDDAIKTKKVAAKVHKLLDPKDVKLRESRDCDAHPVTVPIAVMLDTTGSMAQVPMIIEKALATLMGHFLEDKASGKKYLGDGYPAILIGAVDDYAAMQYLVGNASGTLQVGQFESGMEIDQMLENLWLTGQGGGTYQENYDLALYFMARHTAHDHMEKRNRKGYLFIIGDEHAYEVVDKRFVEDVIGDKLQDNIKLETIIEEAQELYHVFFVIPNMTQHYNDRTLEKWWVERLGQQNVLKLEDPQKICELIVSAVAICEEHVGLDELVSDGVAAGGVDKTLGALVALRSSSISKFSASGLPAVSGDAEGTERL